MLAKLPKSSSACLRLKDTCYVQNTSPSLISVSRLDEADCYTIFGNGRCISFDITDNEKLICNILSHGKVILTGTKGKDRLYYLDKPTDRKSTDRSYTATKPPRSKLEDLHFRLGHLNYRAVKAIVQKGMVTGVKLWKRDLKIEPPVCASCVKGKMTRASFPPSESGRASQILGRVHSDLWGPAQVRTKEGHRYLMTLTNNKTRWVGMETIPEA